MTLAARPDAGTAGAVVVYRRPGCPFCASLRRSLRRTGLAYAEVDIWDDPQAAAFVRSVAGGNETVPTVKIPGGPALVNPSARQVLAAVAEHAPALLPAEGARPGPGRGARVLRRLTGRGSG